MTSPSRPVACTIRDLLARNARQWPDRVMVRFDSGEQYTADRLLEETRRLASGLLRLGVRRQETVLVWLPNSPLSVLLLLALNYIGAIYVPINTAYRGNLLRHVINNAGARLMLADGRLVERLADMERGDLKRLVIAGEERLAIDDLEQLPVDILRQHGTDPSVLEDIETAPWDTQAVIFTSGTTGPSKGVLCSYRHLYTAAIEFRHVGPGDCSLVALPMFHVGGILGLLFALIHGGCAAFVERFSTSRFWQTVEEMQVTTVGLLGAMVQYLMQQPPTDLDRQHAVKTAVIAPFSDDALAFADRFGIDVYTEFNMTELSVPLYAGPNPTVRGTCGKPRQGVELRIVDEHDIPVPMGETGELVVRTDEPWTLSHGYLNNPEATARSWRNGWFHTGDLFYRDEADNHFFVDRLKDAIRRRGENISSFEVEEELLAHSGIREAAVVAVPGDGGEDEILAVLVTDDGNLPDLKELTGFLQKRMAHFMVPRYFRVLHALPKTPTQKIEKHVLRSEGLTPDCLDREALGLVLKSERLTGE